VVTSDASVNNAHNVTEANVATVRWSYDALNRGDVTGVMSMIDDDITWDPGAISPDSGAGTTGRDAFESFVRSWMDAFEGFRIEPLDVTANGPFLVACVRQSGRGRSSGVKIEIDLVHVWTVENGRAVRLESYRDLATALAAIGA
jgi:uncharacterized protein